MADIIGLVKNGEQVLIGGKTYTKLTYQQFMQLPVSERESGQFIVTGMNTYSNAYNIAYDGNTSVGQKLDAMGEHLLWSNSEEDSGQNLTAFTAQNIPLDLSGYRAIEIVFCNYNRQIASTMKAYILSTVTKYQLNYTAGADSSGWYVNGARREFTLSSSGVTFDTAEGFKDGSASWAENRYCIPLKIYGIK